MSSEARALPDSVIVAGDGRVGLGAAIALRRALPRTRVTIIACPPDAAALADRATTSLPQSGRFHDRIGLDERGFIMRAGASHRLAVQFAGWRRAQPFYTYGYGAIGSVGGPDGDILSVSQCLALGNRFSHPADDNASPLSDIDYALRFDPSGYHGRLTALAKHVGILRIDAPMQTAAADGAHGISHVLLASGEQVSADLYVDCTGPGALLINAMQPAEFQSWSEMLPCDRLVMTKASPQRAVSVTDLFEAHDFGWRSTVFGRENTYMVSALNSSIGNGADSAAMFENAADTIAIRQGRLTNSWSGNVVAFGDAAAAYEPLLWTNLALAHEQILLFLEMLPGRDIDPLERAEYNRRAGAMADRVRDYIALHYCSPCPPQSAFWQHAADLQRSDGLALALSEFARRGRLPFFEEDILPRDAWQSAMACIGIAPGLNALSASLSQQAANDKLESQKSRSAAALKMAAPYPAWLQNYIEANS